MSYPSPLALTPCLPAELLCYLLEQRHPTSLIICISRTAFITSLLESTSTTAPQPAIPLEPNPDPDASSGIRSPQPVPPSNPFPYPGGDEQEETEPFISQSSSQLQPQPQPQPPSPPPPLPPPPQHPLLTPTLHQLSLSRPTTIAYIPTVSHLRAYLSVFSSPPPPPPPPVSVSTHQQHPLLVVYGLVELHRGTSEWSTQGLGSTIAALVEAGCRTGRRVVSVEEKGGSGGVEGKDEDEGEGEGEDGEVGKEEEAVGLDEEREDDDVRGDGLGIASMKEDVLDSIAVGIWHEKLPILSGSSRRPGATAEYAGRTVEVGMVLKRWFKFGRGPWDNG